jgi:hypothetical protein
MSRLFNVVHLQLYKLFWWMGFEYTISEMLINYSAHDRSSSKRKFRLRIKRELSITNRIFYPILANTFFYLWWGRGQGLGQRGDIIIIIKHLLCCQNIFPIFTSYIFVFHYSIFRPLLMTSIWSISLLVNSKTLRVSSVK